MMISIRKCCVVLAALVSVWFGGGVSVMAAGGDVVGLKALWSLNTNLDGSGVKVLQAEASGSASDWQANPSVAGGMAFTYRDADGFTNRFPNLLGAESGHADAVAGLYFQMAPGARSDNCEAMYFYSQVSALAASFSDPIANQSFTFGSLPASIQSALDLKYDNYASQYNMLFISAANNGGSVCAPATSYNGIAVGAYGGSSSVGPTIDNGRAKPDLTAPASATSFSTPLVTGAAALLRQAALRGDGGSTCAADMRVIKALLLNGAVKPADWTNLAPSPLDVRYGAGVLNVLNSYKQLAGGQCSGVGPVMSATNGAAVVVGGVYPARRLSGWDLSTNSSTLTSNGVMHYCFTITNAASSSPFTATATLVWNRQPSMTAINNLDLLLVNADSGALMACSTSHVDNVQHIYVPQLSPGRYDLQVVKHGGAFVSANETYALAFEFFSMPLNIQPVAGGTLLSWPVYPAGFSVQVTRDLTSPRAWNSLTNLTPTITNGQNYVVWPQDGNLAAFRLSR